MVEVLYGKHLAQELREKIRNAITGLSENCRKPSLVILIAGNDSASIYYAHLIEKAGVREGISVTIEQLQNPKTQDVLGEIEKLNNDNSVDAVLIQLPLPKNIDKVAVFNKLSPDKDVDGQTTVNQGRLLSGQEGIFPATARSIIGILKGNNVEIAGKKVVVVGRSTAVGMPAVIMLIHENATVTVCHSKSKPLEEFTRNADILVVSAGVAELIKADHIKKDSVVIDVGTNEVDGKMVGDVDFEEVKEIATVSPVIGGVGSLTLACLLENTYELYRKNIHRNRD